MVFKRGVGIVNEDRDLAGARGVGQLREGDRHPRAARFHGRRRAGRDRGQPRGERPHRRLHAAVGQFHRPLGQPCGLGDERRPADAIGVVHAPRQRRGDHVDEVVDHEAAKGHRQEFAAEDQSCRHRHLRAVPLLREFAGGHRDRNPHEVERVAGRVGDVVAFVDPPQFVQVVEVARELVELDRGLERDRVGLELHAVGGRGHLEGGRPRDHALAGPLHLFVGGGEHRVDLVEDGARVRRARHLHKLRPAAPAAGGLQGHRHPQKRLIASPQRRVRPHLESLELAAELLFVFVAVAGEAVLPPHIRLLGHDRAVAVEIAFEPLDLPAHALGAGVAGHRRRLAVLRPRHGRETVEEPGEVAGGGGRRVEQGKAGQQQPAGDPMV